jgi:catechol 2,3-dioxygenase-like lactoylglutathione lyase family enzyme
MKIEGVDHVQLPIPFGGLERARAFYQDLLGLDEVQHPMIDRPGTLHFALGWQRLDLSEGSYTGVAPQAHLALRVRQVRQLAQHLTTSGQRVQSAPLSDGTPRVYVEDPFGNRLELIEVEGAQLAFASPRRVTDLQLSV